MLLYFDSVAFPLFVPKMPTQESLRLSLLHGAGGATTFGDYLALQTYITVSKTVGFHKEYDSLLNENVIVEWLVESVWKQALSSTPDIFGPSGDLAAFVKFFIESNMAQSMLDWNRDAIETGIRGCLKQSATLGASASLMLEYLRQYHPHDLNATVDEVAVKRHFELLMLDMFLFGMNALTTDIFVGSADAQALVPFLSSPARIAIDEVEFRAARILATALPALPLAMPKSADSILEMRHRLGDELGDLRNTLREAARTVTYDDSASYQKAAFDAIEKPLNSLRRRLAYPNRDLLRNLVTQAGVVSAIIAVGTAWLPHGPDFWSSILAASVATGAAAGKTLLDRAKMSEDSGVGFFLKAFR